MGSFEARRPSHFPATLLKSLTAAGCHWRVSHGAVELQATMRCKKAKPINPTIFFIYILWFEDSIGTFLGLPDSIMFSLQAQIPSPYERKQQWRPDRAYGARPHDLPRS